MIDTDKYTGHTEGPWYLIGADQIVYDKDNNPVAEVEYFAQEHRSYYNKALIADAPLILADYKRLRNRVKTEKNLKLWEKAEVKRLREAIADIANNMEAADDSYMSGFIEDLRKVIE